MQFNSDFISVNAITILRISSQCLSLSFCNFSAIVFHSWTWFWSFSLSICNCWTIVWSRLTSHSIICLFWNSVVILFSRSRSSRTTSLCFSCSLFILTMKLASFFEKSRILFRDVNEKSFRKEIYFIPFLLRILLSVEFESKVFERLQKTYQCLPIVL